VSIPNAAHVNGYEVEQSMNGAWWVRRPGSRLTWRFDSREAALRFAEQLHRPATAGAQPRSAGERRREAATEWQAHPSAEERADLLHLLERVSELSARTPENAPVARELVAKMEALLLHPAA